MVDKFMTYKKFMTGFNRYLKETAYKAATKYDLWTYLEKEMILNNIPSLREVMESWTKTPGFPLVTIIRNYDSCAVTFKQERFKTSLSIKPQYKNTLWWIPLDYV